MFKIGEKQLLTVAKKVEFGIYLEEKNGDLDENGKPERVLLPAKYVPDNTEIGNELEVFIYKDSSDRIIATTEEPLLTIGKPAKLYVSQVTKIGAFLDWGLPKELLLPFKQQTRKVKEGEQVLVSLYIDKSNRLCATMNVYKELSCDSPYKTGDEVRGTIYQNSDTFGMFVAVDDMFSAIIPKKEMYGELKIGDSVKARVTSVREDGKINLSVRDKSYVQMYSDMDKLLEILDEYNGVLPFTEKATPEVIKRETGMSKNEFKRAVGHLYKEHKIDIADGKIRKVSDVM